jgi:hypothetical protein
VLKRLVEACAGMESLHSITTPFARTPCKPAEWLKKAENMLMDLGWVRSAEQARKVGLPPGSRRLLDADDRRHYDAMMGVVYGGGDDDATAMAEPSQPRRDVTTTDQYQAMQGKFRRSEYVPDGSVCDLFSRARDLVFGREPPRFAEGKSRWNELSQ